MSRVWITNGDNLDVFEATELIKQRGTTSAATDHGKANPIIGAHGSKGGEGGDSRSSEGLDETTAGKIGSQRIH